MPLGITEYVPPGTYVKQNLQPGSVSVSSERILGIVATAPRSRRSSDEAVTRGKIYDETLTLAVSTPYIATLSVPSNRDRNSAILYRNDNAMALGNWSFNSAALIGDAWAGADIDVSSGTGTAQYLTVSLDGIVPVTIDLDAAVTAVGGTTNAATGLIIAAAINYDLGDAAGDHYATYGAAYAAVASSAVPLTPTITITSPLTTSASDVKVFLSELTAKDGASEVSNTGWAPTAGVGVQADTIVTVVDAYYGSTDTYTIEYVSIENMVDALLLADSTDPLISLIRAGSFPGSESYLLNTDFEKTSNTVDWATSSWAQAIVTSVDGTFAIVVSVNDEVRLGINGLDPITVSIAASATQSAAVIAAAINAALAASVLYGPAYAHVATVDGLTVVLTAPSAFANYPTARGYSSTVELFTSTDTAVTTIFGIASGSLPYEARGTGERPAFGSVYYSTYDYTRPDADYLLPTRVYTLEQLSDFTSPPTIENYTVNRLYIAGDIAFENGAPSLWVVPIDDSTVSGTPTPTQVNSAIDVCEEKSGITDIVVIDTAVAQHVHLMNHVANMSSLINKKYRRGWFGMARSTSVGDPDTPDTFVYRSQRTLQPGNTSPGRGRLILCAPSEASRVLTLDDKSEVTLELDGSYIAVADASVMTALPSPSDALLGKQIVGFLTDDTFETYLTGENKTLASNGVNVNTLDAGLIKMTDPLTTESAGSVEFQEPSSSAQKDVVTRSIETLVDGNLKGIVPDDLADFIVDIKTWVSLGIKANINSGVIAPYRTSTGASRDINLMTDIDAYQDEDDPRSFVFKYWYNLKYVAKRFFGEYSVDNPFFAG